MFGSHSMSDEKETEVKIDEGAVLVAVKKTKDDVLSALQSYVLYGGMDINACRRSQFLKAVQEAVKSPPLTKNDDTKVA